MKTQIILKEGWEILKEYDLIIAIHTGNVVSVNNVEYYVYSAGLDCDKNIYKVIVGF